MRTAIVYYSMGGNTAMVAEKLAEALSADLVPVRPQRAYPDKGFRKFLWGGKSAVMAETPELEPYAFPADQYGRIVFGFPVWASNMAPPLRTFIRDNRDALKGKEIAAFVCESGSGGEKALRKLAECLGLDFVSPATVLIDPKDRPKPENEQKIGQFLEQLAG